MNVEWVRMLEDSDLWEVTMQEQDKPSLVNMKVHKDIKTAPLGQTKGLSNLTSGLQQSP